MTATATTHARSLGDAVPIFAGHVEHDPSRPRRAHAAGVDPAALGNPFHVIAAHIEPDPWTYNPRGTEHDQQSATLADNECPHGHLPTDGRISCDCWELARIRREAAAAAVELEAETDELLELAADPAPVELCECGCGDELTQPRSGRRRRYAPGHAPSSRRAEYQRDRRQRRSRGELPPAPSESAAAQRRRRAAARADDPARFCRCGCGTELPKNDRRRVYAADDHIPGGYDPARHVWRRYPRAQEAELVAQVERDLDELLPD